MPAPYDTIRRFEEHSINEWPALQTLLLDGWVLRFANGYTRRANSVNALYESTREPLEKIAACEALYAQQGLKTTFKITSANEQSALDLLLAGCGYLKDAPTSV